MTPFEEQVLAELKALRSENRDLKTRLVRLEWFLKEQDIIKGTAWYVSDEERYVLENGFDARALDGDREERQLIRADDVERVLDWLDAHRDDPQASFYQMEDDLGGRGQRLMLIDVCQVLRIRGQFTDVIKRLITNMHPSEAKTITEDPYKYERTR